MRHHADHAQFRRSRITSWLTTMAWMSLAPTLVVGCGQQSDGGRSCDTCAKAAVNASVLGGAATGQCNVEVTVTATGFEEQLECLVEGTTCKCFGVWERVGTYEVTVTRAGVVVASKTATVTPGECHVNSVSLEFDATAPGEGGSDGGDGTRAGSSHASPASGVERY